MEEEAREILRLNLTSEAPNLAVAIRQLFEPLGGVDLPEFPDEPMTEPVLFDE